MDTRSVALSPLSGESRRVAQARILAEAFGRKTILGILEGRSEAYVWVQARLAASYAAIVLEERR